MNDQDWGGWLILLAVLALLAIFAMSMGIKQFEAEVLRWIA